MRLFPAIHFAILVPWLWPGDRALAAASFPDVSLLRVQKAINSQGQTRTFLTDERFERRKTAIVVVDMWDRHWCKTYTTRVAEMVPRMNQTIAAARALDIPIIWAPSDVLEFYQAFPQRRKMLAAVRHPELVKSHFDPPPSPAPWRDRCECGPGDPCRVSHAHTRQHPGLDIAETDLIADANNGEELLNVCSERGIDTLIYLGVASNMCVSHRNIALINMRRHGLRTFFIRDLVQAFMGNGINPSTGALDANFTPAKGSALAARFLEEHIAGSIESRQLLRLARPSPPEPDPRPHVVFVIADEEYHTGETLPAFARQRLEPALACTFVHANPTNRNDVPGLSVLADADLLVLSMRRRFLPVAQMDHLEYFIRANKPLVALRVSSTPFAESGELKRKEDGLVVWQNFDQEVLGCHYDFYDAAARKDGSDVWAVTGGPSPVLRGLADWRFHSSSWIYRVKPLAADAQVVLLGRWSTSQPEQPVAWTRTRGEGRLFYTSLGHPDDFKIDAFQTLLANAIHWTLGRDPK